MAFAQIQMPGREYMPQAIQYLHIASTFLPMLSFYHQHIRITIFFPCLSFTMRTIPSLRDFDEAPYTITYDFLDDRQHMSRMFYDGVIHILEYGCHSTTIDGKGERSEIGE